MNDFNKQMEMVLYHSDEGNVSVDAYIAEDSIWVSQKGMSEILLFGKLNDASFSTLNGGISA